MIRKLSLLGSTGSIGTQALRVCGKLGIAVEALSANRSVKLLEEQARQFRPRLVAVMDPDACRDLGIRLKDTPTRVVDGMQGLCEAAALDGCDGVLNAVVGMVGLRPTLCALEAGKPLALANKETLVAAGALVMRTAREHGAAIYPVDSEHSAIFQCLQGNAMNAVRRILLTASGGPFFGFTRAQLAGVRVEDALRHPNWSMGAKITIDSATLMNKGLEFIEAMWLFGVSPEQIEVVVHRESIVHSAVEYADGCVMAQLGVPDMALPIQYALTYPDRPATGLARPLDLFAAGKLTFCKPDLATFGCLGAAVEAAGRGGLAPCVVNAANEAAVALFLERRIGFLQIEECVRGALEQVPAGDYTSLREVLDAADAAQEYVRGAL